MNDRQKTAFSKVAQIFADLSYAKKLKVGAIMVKDDRIISIGYNGTPSGWDNECEYIVGYHPGPGGSPILKTKPEVLHAEMNCIAKLAKSNESGAGATMFVTHSPCMECAKAIKQAGIHKVFYQHEYKNNTGVDFLEACGITAERFTP